MNFLKKLFSSSSKPQRNDFTFTVKCKRCGADIQGRINLFNGLRVEYEDHNEWHYSRAMPWAKSDVFNALKCISNFQQAKHC